MTKRPTDECPSDILPDEPSYSYAQHIAAVEALWKDYPYNSPASCEAHRVSIYRQAFGTRIPVRIGSELDDAISDTLVGNLIHAPHLSITESRPYLNLLQARFSTLLLARLAEDALVAFLHNLNARLPPVVYDDEENPSPIVPLYALLPPALPEFIFASFSGEIAGERIFLLTYRTLFSNIIRASGFDPDTYDGRRRLMLASDYEGTPEEALRIYLNDTPFLALFRKPVPFAIPRRLYTEHAAIFAPSGHGKTQLLQSLITGFLHEDPPGMFILDSQGDMLRKIERLDLFQTSLKDRLVIIDPEDANPPALNFFQIGEGAGTDAQLHELFNYLFSAIDSELTSKQGTAVTYLLKLMRLIPGATIETLKDVMEEQVKNIENSRYFKPISELDQISQDFFRNQFFDKAMGPTRNQVARRLYTVLGNTTFQRMFAAKENRFSALEAMRERKIVLINTSQRFLGQEASAVFGRFMIAQCLAAAYERGVSDDLSLLIVDEASEYFDAKTERILSQARKYGLGLIFATQYLEQMPPQVKAAVNGNTAIKLAGPVGYNDAMMLSREMYTSPQTIRAMTKTASATQFAAYVRSLTPQAVPLTIPFGTLEQQPTMTEEMRHEMRRANAAKYGVQTHEPPTTGGPDVTCDDSIPSAEPDIPIPPKPWEKS